MVSISGVTSGLKTIYSYGKRALEVAPELAFGSASEATGKAIKATKGSIFKKAEAGWKALEKAGSGSFFKNFGSKMPFIMSAMWMVMEAPNVYTAVKEKGIFQGVKEVLKFGARMTTAGLGSAIGAALPIPGGSLIGWMVGEWIASRIVGKRYTDQKEEKEALIKELTGQNPNEQTQQTQQQQVPNPYWLNNQTAYQPQQTSFSGNMSNPFDYNQYKLQSMPYANDIMMQQMPFNAVA